MKLIPGLPRLERKPDLRECSMPDCTRRWYTLVCTWPVCRGHYIDHLDAEGMERLTQKTHTAKLIESEAPLAGAGRRWLALAGGLNMGDI